MKEDIFLGEYKVKFGPILKEKIYRVPCAGEIFRHRYSLSPEYEAILDESGMKIEGKTDDGRVVAVCLESNTFHFGVQYHPELNSTLECVDPIITSYIKAVINE